MPLPITVEKIHKYDTTEQWRQKTNSFIDSLDEVAAIVSTQELLDEQFKYTGAIEIADPTTIIGINGGIIRDKSELIEKEQTALSLSSQGVHVVYIDTNDYVVKSSLVAPVEKAIPIYLVTLDENLQITSVEDIRTWATTNFGGLEEESVPVEELFITTTDQTVFTLRNGKTTGVTVYVDGIRQREGVAFNVTGEREITFTEPVGRNSKVLIIGNVSGSELAIATYIQNSIATINGQTDFVVSAFSDVTKNIGVWVQGIRQHDYTVDAGTNTVILSSGVDIGTVVVVTKLEVVGGSTEDIPGGTDGQIIVKQSSVEDDWSWETPSFDTSVFTSGQVPAYTVDAANFFNWTFEDDQRLVTPSQQISGRFVHLINSWSEQRIGSSDNFYLTGRNGFSRICTKYQLDNAGNDYSEFYQALSNGRIIKNSQDILSYGKTEVTNASFPVNDYTLTRSEKYAGYTLAGQNYNKFIVGDDSTPNENRQQDLTNLVAVPYANSEHPWYEYFLVCGDNNKLAVMENLANITNESKGIGEKFDSDFSGDWREIATPFASGWDILYVENSIQSPRTMSQGNFIFVGGYNKTTNMSRVAFTTSARIKKFLTTGTAIQWTIVHTLEGFLAGLVCNSCASNHAVNWCIGNKLYSMSDKQYNSFDVDGVEYGFAYLGDNPESLEPTLGTVAQSGNLSSILTTTNGNDVGTYFTVIKTNESQSLGVGGSNNSMIYFMATEDGRLFWKFLRIAGGTTTGLTGVTRQVGTTNPEPLEMKEWNITPLGIGKITNISILNSAPIEANNRNDNNLIVISGEAGTVFATCLAGLLPNGDDSTKVFGTETVRLEGSIDGEIVGMSYFVDTLQKGVTAGTTSIDSYNGTDGSPFVLYVQNTRGDVEAIHWQRISGAAQDGTGGLGVSSAKTITYKRAHTSDNSPVPPVSILSVISDGETRIAVSSAPTNCIWVIKDSQQGGEVMPVQGDIIGGFYEGNRFFIVTTKFIYSSLNGVDWDRDFYRPTTENTETEIDMTHNVYDTGEVWFLANDSDSVYSTDGVTWKKTALDVTIDENCTVIAPSQITPISAGLPGADVSLQFGSPDSDGRLDAHRIQNTPFERHLNGNLHLTGFQNGSVYHSFYFHSFATLGYLQSIEIVGAFVNSNNQLDSRNRRIRITPVDPNNTLAGIVVEVLTETGNLLTSTFVSTSGNQSQIVDGTGGTGFAVGQNTVLESEGDVVIGQTVFAFSFPETVNGGFVYLSSDQEYRYIVNGFDGYENIETYTTQAVEIDSGLTDYTLTARDIGTGLVGYTFDPDTDLFSGFLKPQASLPNNGVAITRIESNATGIIIDVLETDIAVVPDAYFTNLSFSGDFVGGSGSYALGGDLTQTLVERGITVDGKLVTRFTFAYSGGLGDHRFVDGNDYTVNINNEQVGTIYGWKNEQAGEDGFFVPEKKLEVNDIELHRVSTNSKYYTQDGLPEATVSTTEAVDTLGGYFSGLLTSHFTTAGAFILDVNGTDTWNPDLAITFGDGYAALNAGQISNIQNGIWTGLTATTPTVVDLRGASSILPALPVTTDIPTVVISGQFAILLENTTTGFIEDVVLQNLDFRVPFKDLTSAVALDSGIDGLSLSFDMDECSQLQGLIGQTYGSLVSAKVVFIQDSTYYYNQIIEGVPVQRDLAIEAFVGDDVDWTGREYMPNTFFENIEITGKFSDAPSVTKTLSLSAGQISLVDTQRSVKQVDGRNVTRWNFLLSNGVDNNEVKFIDTELYGIRINNKDLLTDSNSCVSTIANSVLPDKHVTSDNTGKMVGITRTGRLISSVDGVTWAEVDTPVQPTDNNEIFTSIQYTNREQFFIAGRKNGKVVQSFDGGDSWIESSPFVVTADGTIIPDFFVDGAEYFVDITGKNRLMFGKTNRDRFFVSTSGLAWLNIRLPLHSKDGAGIITYDTKGNHFATTKQINNKTGTPPVYYQMKF